MIGDIRRCPRGIIYVKINRGGTEKKCGKIGFWDYIKFVFISQRRPVLPGEVDKAVKRYEERKNK